MKWWADKGYWWDVTGVYGSLTAKEHDILCLLVANKGMALPYKHIYETVWGEKGLGNESNAVGCQVRKLRKKLYAEPPESLFTIRCVREVGYCLDVSENKTPIE